MRLRGDLEPPHERDLAPERDLHVAPAGELEDRPRVPLDVGGGDVARDACDGPQVGLIRRAGVEEGKQIVDPGIDVEDERDPFRHARMLAIAFRGGTRHP